MKKAIIYVLIILLILTSGTNTLYGLELGYLFPLLLLGYRYYNGKELAFQEYLFLALFFFLLLFQTFRFDGNVKSEILSFLSLCSVLLIGKLVSKDFKGYFVKIVYFLCWSSLIIWAVIQASDPFKQMLIGIAKSLPHFTPSDVFFWQGEVTSYNAYIYNVNEVQSQRNNSIFYEPGRFAIYICFAYIINVFYNNEKMFSKRNIIFLLALITTFSTTGYVAFSVILGMIIFRSKTNILAKFFGLIAFMSVVYYISSLDFMAEKILDQVNETGSYSRFAAFFYHFTYIVESPYVGYGGYLPPLELSPNGISFLILKYGIVFAPVYFYLLYHGTKSIIGSRTVSTPYVIGIFVAMVLLAFSQTITTEPFYMVIMFIGLDYIATKHG